MILALHSLVYADDPVAARAFFRDVLGFANVDTGGGWLIFRTGPSELGVHPTSEEGGERYATSGQMEFSLACDDIEATVADLTAKGAEFTRPIRDDGFGLTTEVRIPGAGGMMIYQARYPLPALMEEHHDEG